MQHFLRQLQRKRFKVNLKRNPVFGGGVLTTFFFGGGEHGEESLDEFIKEIN